jgi:hypothetical protein
MRLVQVKPSEDLFWAVEQRMLHTVPVHVEEGILLTYQVLNPLCKELPKLLLE